MNRKLKEAIQRKEDKKFILDKQIRDIFRSKYKKGVHESPTLKKYLRYDLTELELHIEKQFVPGMNFQNFGKVWHIDHVIPRCMFSYTNIKDADFQKCWALRNLQPLFAKDNLRKKKKKYERI
jgi:hypothetical protein